jgi:hypothetical protein
MGFSLDWFELKSHPILLTLLTTPLPHPLTIAPPLFSIPLQQRREKDEHRVAELRVEMGKMEKSLTAEIKRRIEMNKSIQAWCEQQIVMMQEKFEVAIEER